MKLAFVLLLCSCISASMQQQSMYDSLWSYMPSWSSWQMPYSYNLIDYFSSGTGYFRGEPEPYQQPQYHPLPSVPKFKQGLQASSHQPQLSDLIAIAQSGAANQRPKEGLEPIKEEQAKLGFSEPRTLLKLLGFDYLANYVINSLSFSTTSTIFTTSTSTVTVGTILTCYTRTMFRSTTACRRKRRLLPGLLVGDDGFESPSKVESVEPSLKWNLESLAREVRSADSEPANIEIASSMNTEMNADNEAAASSLAMSESSINRYIRNEKDSRILVETEFFATSTVTTYSLYTTTVTKTVTNIASSTALTCLPACFVLC